MKPDGVVGVLLAAGAGRRAGGPKALRVDPDGTSWLLRSIAVLRDGGCADVVVVLGSQAERARDLIAHSSGETDPAVTLVDAPDWEQGMGASLRTGLLAVQQQAGRAALVHLVDLPDVTEEVVRRLLRQAPPGSGALARATYGGRPGHPVLIGRDHLPWIIEGRPGTAEPATISPGTRLMVWNVVIWRAAATATTPSSREGESEELCPPPPA